MKYKLTGIANYLIGGVQLFVALALILFIIPRMQSIFQEFNVETQTSLIKTYLAPTINLITGILGIFLGHKMFSSNGKVLEKYFTISIIYLFFTFIAAGIVTQLSVLSAIMPIYSLTTSLN